MDQSGTPPRSSDGDSLAFFGGAAVADVETMIFELGSGHGGVLGYAACAAPIEEDIVQDEALGDSLDEQILGALVAL